MPIEPEWILVYLLVGSIVGLLAGLLGIGGGAVMVPTLTTIFAVHGFSDSYIVHMAIASSMAAIIITSYSSLKAHHKHDAVIWPIVKQISPGILAGTFITAVFIDKFSTLILTAIFAIFIALVAWKLLLNVTPKPSRKLPGRVGISLVGASIGSISALVAIGGGTMSVPFMIWCNINAHKAVGTSAAIGFPIAIAGSLGYLVSGWNISTTPEYTLGYIYLPAVILISITSYITAPIGARVAHNLPLPTLKRLFAILLILLCGKMLHTIL